MVTFRHKLQKWDFWGKNAEKISFLTYLWKKLEQNSKRALLRNSPIKADSFVKI